MKIIVLASAERELAKAARYYLEHASPSIAQAFVNEFRHVSVCLSEYPEIGPIAYVGQRVFHFRRFPYSVIYRVTADQIVIRAIAHQSRKPAYWHKPLPPD